MIGKAIPVLLCGAQRWLVEGQVKALHPQPLDKGVQHQVDGRLQIVIQQPGR